jgi:hypothetical protein
MTTMDYDRRSLLGLSLGFAGALAMAPLALPAAARASTASAAVDPVQLLRKLKFRSDDGLIFWWLQGPKIGQVGATLTPLYTSGVGTIQRARQLEDGGIELTQLEMLLMFDLDTGALLEEWRNPYTGEVLPIRFRPVGPLKVQYRADNSRILPTELGGTPLEATAKSHPPLIVADDVFVQDESVARVFTPGRERPFEVNDIAVYHGSLQNLADPGVAMGEATVFFAEVTDWQRWMNMGDRPGTLTSRMVGRKCARWEDLPETWRRRLAEVAPAIAADPVAALDQPAGRFER